MEKHQIKASKVETPFSSWEVLPNLALLAVKYHIAKGRPSWHWSIFERNKDRPVVHDPAGHLEINQREDFDNIEPKWFIEIIDKRKRN